MNSMYSIYGVYWIYLIYCTYREHTCCKVNQLDRRRNTGRSFNIEVLMAKYILNNTFNKHIIHSPSCAVILHLQHILKMAYLRFTFSARKPQKQCRIQICQMSNVIQNKEACRMQISLTHFDMHHFIFVGFRIWRRPGRPGTAASGLVVVYGSRIYIYIYIYIFEG